MSKTTWGMKKHDNIISECAKCGPGLANWRGRDEK